MLFSKCLRAKIYCNMNGHFDPQGCQTLLLKESEPFFLSLGSWTITSFVPILDCPGVFKHSKELFPHLKGIFYHFHFPHKLLKIASEMLYRIRPF